jgi:hypothetical protein
MSVLRTATASGTLRIERFVCPRCGRTLSVPPKNRLPYIALNTAIVELIGWARRAWTGEENGNCRSRWFISAEPIPALDSGVRDVKHQAHAPALGK